MRIEILALGLAVVACAPSQTTTAPAPATPPATSPSTQDTTRTTAEMVLDGPPHLKMACGENPKRVYGREKKSFPMTRMGNYAGYRDAFEAARTYRTKKAT